MITYEYFVLHSFNYPVGSAETRKMVFSRRIFRISLLMMQDDDEDDCRRTRRQIASVEGKQETSSNLHYQLYVVASQVPACINRTDSCSDTLLWHQTSVID